MNFQQWILSQLSDEFWYNMQMNIEGMMRQLLERAREGDIESIKLVLRLTLGPPADFDA